ncbi:Replication-associated protein [Geodia barretti]|uniref:ATP-dependent helicase Rep n=1 Tax=Geodia barretti TaxID=519541 RepID=A0AA35TX99_GEOBA|nr:Replication-associated protein [Geodia barretti]
MTNECGSHEKHNNTHGSGSRAINWCWTLNNPTDEEISAIQSFSDPPVHYLTYGRETGDEGTPHLQGYLQFDKRKTFPFIKSLFPRRTHLEVQKARDNKQAREYCHKEDQEPYEKGDFKDNHPKGPSAAETRRKAYADIKRGKSLQEIIDDNPEELSYIHQAARYAPARTLPAKVLYLHGKTGCGKTTSTLNVLLKHDLQFFKKMPGTHWFDGYTGQPVMVLEEFQSCFTLTKFLSMCDPYPPQLEVKGGTMPNRSTHIIICSNSGPFLQYQDVQDKRPASYAAFLRRISQEHDCSHMTHEEIERHITSFLTEL